MADKVKFGVRNVHYAVMTEDATPTYDTPVPIPGAVSLSLTPEGGMTTFNADDMAYFVTVANNGYSGDLEVAYFPDEFFEDIFGMAVSTNDKVMTEDAGVQPKSVALLFEEEGDTTGTKYALYNVIFARPSRSLATTTETIEPQTQTASITASPLSSRKVMAMTTAETPPTVSQGWYDDVWLTDSTSGVGG